jgi:hypothetical protein
MKLEILGMSGRIAQKAFGVSTILYGLVDRPMLACGIGGIRKEMATTNTCCIKPMCTLT